MSTVIRKFFGDTERAFDLTPALVIELERITGAGVGALCKRLFASEFTFREMLEVIRLGMIGGGTKPEEAAALIKAYGEDRPLSETYPLAVDILEARWFGVKPAPVSDDAPATDEAAS